MATLPLCVLLTLVLATAALAEDKAAPPIPVKKVVLYNAGVGYFERQAEIEGNVKFDLRFNVTDINDLLKSMVVQDLGGGKVSAVTYASMEPITKTLKTFAIDLTDNPTLADLLGQVRGEEVEVAIPESLTGTILGVETRQQAVGDGDKVVETRSLNLLTDEGLRSVPLSQVSRIKLVDPKLDAELRQALAVLALGHATDKKTVSLNFAGDKKRGVRVGYVQQAPIWRTTYRLVLDEKKEPYLQGWALVENPTEEDWQTVDLTLVSGRPISFVMDLYRPLYLPRPQVELEQFASLRPQVYGQDLSDAAATPPAAKDDKWYSGARLGRNMPQMRSAGQGEVKDLGVALRATESMGGEGRGELNLADGVASVAQGGDVGELFQYAIDSPVTLPRQQSAMLPIINGAVQGEKVSIYNSNVQPKHPLNGLKLKNSTGLHLMQGPLTVFDEGAYAGDARIEDLPPDAERLISYALDLDVEVAGEAQTKPEELNSVKIAKGMLTSTRKLRRSQTYTIKNSGRGPKNVLIEYPHNADWKLVAPQSPAEKTRDMYRFAVAVEPGKSTKLDIAEEQLVSQQLALTSLTDDQIVLYQRSAVVSEKVKQALGEFLQRKTELQSLAQRRNEQEQLINSITQEQTRIRENMSRLERNNDLYLRYVKKFGQQEDQIEAARKKSAELEVEIQQRQQALDKFMLGIELE